jgi:hypothetical protein
VRVIYAQGAGFSALDAGLNSANLRFERGINRAVRSLPSYRNAATAAFGGN